MPSYQNDFALANDSTDPAVLTRLAGHKSWRVVGDVVKNPNTPVAVLEALAEHYSFMVRARVAEFMPVLGPWEARFAADADTAVRRGLAKHAGLSEQTLRGLLADPHEDVRKALAWATGHPDWVWSALLADRSEVVREALARNRSIPGWVLTALASDRSTLVRSRVAYSGRLGTEAILAMLAADPSAALPLSRKKDVEYAEEVLAAFCRSADKWVRCNVVDRPSCPPSILAILAEDLDVEVRSRVARHPNATTDILVGLALGRSAQVLSHLSQREGGLEFLVSNPDPAVRKKAVQVVARDLTEAEAWQVLPALLADEDPKVRAAAVEAAVVGGQGEDALCGMVGDPDKGVRVAVAKCARSERTLAGLVGDREWVVRRAVAANRACPPHLLTELSDDPHLNVRKAAADAFLAAFTR